MRLCARALAYENAHRAKRDAGTVRRNSAGETPGIGRSTPLRRVGKDQKYYYLFL